MRTIGLTGGIGCGKTAVAEMLAEIGAEVINADLVGHEVYRPGTKGFDEVTGEFGRDIVGRDGVIDRKRLGALVFGDPTALARLTRIVHPLIADEVQRRIEARRQDGSWTPIVVEAAVLIEASWQSLVDEVWVVVAKPEAVVERISAERGLPADQIEARMRAQLTDAERRKHADVVIENFGTLDELRTKVLAAWSTSR